MTAERKINSLGGEFKKRPIRFLELWRENGWTVKIYGISSPGEFPEPEFVEKAKELARRTLPLPALTGERYGTAFVTIHRAAMFNQIIFDWWERVNELRHRVFKAEPEQPASFREITASGEAFCVWELRVIAFERDAWVEKVLMNPNQNGLEEYLNSQLNEDA
jgi:hypothetical protein